MDSIINSFRLQQHLNSDIWENAETGDFNIIKLDSEVRMHLLHIAKDFIESFKLEAIEIEDVLFVGSLANYNWSSYSDVDLHVLIDKKALGDNEAVIDELFDAKKSLYLLKHDIKIKNFDVELYAQDVDEPLESQGQYSVLYSKWLQTPERDEFNLDKQAIIKKIKEFNKLLNTVESMEAGDAKVARLHKLADKIKAYRKAGLKRGGELSNENLVFKYLRRSGFMGKLGDLKIQTKDSVLSVDEVEL